MPKPFRGCVERKVKKRICRACKSMAAEPPIAVEPPVEPPVETTKRPKRDVPPRVTFEDEHHNRDAHRLWDWRHPAGSDTTTVSIFYSAREIAEDCEFEFGLFHSVVLQAACRGADEERHQRRHAPASAI